MLDPYFPSCGRHALAKLTRRDSSSLGFSTSERGENVSVATGFGPRSLLAGSVRAEKDAKRLAAEEAKRDELS
jgi:hypothetical protein